MFKKIFLSFALLVAFNLTTTAIAAENPKVKLQTSEGNIVVELYPDKAPQTVENFLEYVNSGFYNGTIFHRVIDGFMIQGGGLTENMQDKPTREPIKNEAASGLKNEKYTLAMARTSEPHSASSQFFINVKNNPFLNYASSTPQGFGYCVFGKVIKGQDVVDKIKSTPTGQKGMHSDVPLKPIIIEKAEVIS